MFRVVSPPIIKSTHNCIYSTWYLSNRYCYLQLLWKNWDRFECGVGIVLICFGAVADVSKENCRLRRTTSTLAIVALGKFNHLTICKNQTLCSNQNKPDLSVEKKTN